MGGSGGYNLGKHIGASIGHRIGIGRRMGSSIGGSVQKIVRQAAPGLLKGHGLYTTNSLIKKGAMFEGVPSFTSEKNETGTLTITHREYLTDVFGNAAKSGSTTQSIPFVNTTYSINPGLETTFPWLSQIAANYEEYEMKQLAFTYKSIIADIGSSTNGQVGTCIMATNYNSAKPAFTDKQEMMEYDAAASTKVTASMIHAVECDPNKLGGSKSRYVRTAPVSTGEDIKTYDQGKFQIAFANTPVAYADQTLGELWVSYTVKLRKPKFAVARGLNIQRAIFYNNNTMDPTMTTSNLFSSYYLKGQQNNFGGMKLIRDNNMNYILFPASYAGFIRVLINMQGFGFTGATTIVLSGNITPANTMYAGMNTVPDPTTGSYVYTTNNSTLTIDLTVQMASNGMNNGIEVKVPAGATGVTMFYIDVCEINPAMKQSEVLTSPAWLNYQDSLVTIAPLA